MSFELIEKLHHVPVKVFAQKAADTFVVARRDNEVSEKTKLDGDVVARVALRLVRGVTRLPMLLSQHLHELQRIFPCDLRLGQV